MTEFQHFMVGAGINFILWHAFFKKYFVTKKDVKAWTKIVKKWFKNDT